MASNRSLRLNDMPLRAAVFAVLAVAMAGCGSGRPVMEGLVTLDGDPIAKGSIMLMPANGKGQTAGTGIVGGRYRMEASPGAMKVIINAPTKAGTMFDPAPVDTPRMIDRYVERVPERYNAATELEVTVVPGRNTFDFALEGEKTPRK
jgi:hypothetical protein